MGSGVIRSQILKSKELILNEARNIHGFMDLLMKQRNTGDHWTRAEKVQLKRYLWHLAACIPVLFVFLLPGGFVLIPVLAEVLDRRKQRRYTTLEGTSDLTEPTRKPTMESAAP